MGEIRPDTKKSRDERGGQHQREKKGKEILFIFRKRTTANGLFWKELVVLWEGVE